MHSCLVRLIRSTKARKKNRKPRTKVSFSVSEFWLPQDRTKWDQLPTEDDFISKCEAVSEGPLQPSLFDIKPWQGICANISSLIQVYIYGSSSPIAFSSSDTGQSWEMLGMTTGQEISSIWLTDFAVVGVSWWVLPSWNSYFHTPNLDYLHFPFISQPVDSPNISSSELHVLFS